VLKRFTLCMNISRERWEVGEVPLVSLWGLLVNVGIKWRPLGTEVDDVNVLWAVSLKKSSFWVLSWFWFLFPLLLAAGFLFRYIFRLLLIGWYWRQNLLSASHRRCDSTSRAWVAFSVVSGSGLEVVVSRRLSDWRDNGVSVEGRTLYTLPVVLICCRPRLEIK